MASAYWGSSYAAPAKRLQWGSATLGSTGYIIIEALTHVVNRNSDIRNSALSTSGTTENMVLLQAGQLDLAQSASVDSVPRVSRRSGQREER